MHFQATIVYLCIKYGLVRAKYGLEIRVGVLHILVTTTIGYVVWLCAFALALLKSGS